MKTPAWFMTSMMACSLGMGIMTSLVTPAHAQTATFADVPTDYWASNYIEALVNLDVVKGFPDGTFRPNDPVTRAQFAALLRQTFATAETPSAQPFNDVAPGYWAAEAITAARTSGFLSGYPGNVFNPEQNISRVQSLVSLTSGLDYQGDDFDLASYYSDTSIIPDYARSSIVAATRSALVVNYPILSQLNPNRQATRAEVAAAIYQALVKQAQAEPLVTTPYLFTTITATWQTEPVMTIPTLAKQIGLSQNGQRLITLNQAGNFIQVWNAQTGEQVISMSSNEATRFEAIALSADGSKVATITQTRPGYRLELLVWDLLAGEPPRSTPLGAIRLLTSNVPEGVAPEFASTSAQVAFGSGDSMMVTQVKLGIDSPGRPGEREQRLHYGATGQILHTLVPTPEAQLSQFEFSPDGQFLAGMGYITPDTGRQLGPVVDVWRVSDGSHTALLRPSTLLSFTDIVFTHTGALKT
ncbi:MAG: S-layer homology domain-containing protein, partial [Phormidesmis sp.]